MDCSTNDIFKRPASSVKTLDKHHPITIVVSNGLYPTSESLILTEDGKKINGVLDLQLNLSAEEDLCMVATLRIINPKIVSLNEYNNSLLASAPDSKG